MMAHSLLLTVAALFLRGVWSITNTNVNTLQQMMNSETPGDLIHRVLKQPRAVGTSGNGS